MFSNAGKAAGKSVKKDLNKKKPKALKTKVTKTDKNGKTRVYYK